VSLQAEKEKSALKWRSFFFLIQVRHQIQCYFFGLNGRSQPVSF